MRKRKNIIISAITCMFSICLMMFGVYAASNPSVNIGGQVSYSARDAKVLVLGKVNGQAGEDQENKVDYPTVADTANPQEDEKVVNASQYMGFTNGTGVNDETDDLAPWKMDEVHEFYEDSTGIRPITISFMLKNLSNYPVVATVDFTGVTDANLASKNLTRETTGLKESKVYLDKNISKEITIKYAVIDDSVGVNSDKSNKNLLDMSITFEKTVFPTPVQSEVQIGEGENVQTVNQSDWKYTFDGESFTLAKFVGDFPQKDSDGNSTLEIPSQVKCEDGTVYPIKTIGTMSDYEFSKAMESGNEELLFGYFAIVNADKLLTDDNDLSEEYFNSIPSNIVIPEGVEIINPLALTYAMGVTSLPNSVKEIGGYSCVATMITALNLPNLTKVGAAAFIYSDELTTINAPNLKEIGMSAFSGCGKLTTVNLPSLSSIGSEAFSNCKSLESVLIHQEDVTKIECFESAFGSLSSDSNLKIYVPVEDYRTAKNWSTYKDHIIVYSKNTNDWTLQVDNDSKTLNIIKYNGDMNVSKINIPACFVVDGELYRTVAVGGTGELNNPSGVEDAKNQLVGEEPVFWNFSENISDFNDSIKSVNIGYGIETIGNFALAGLNGLEDVEIPDSVSKIGALTFYGCSSITKMNLSQNLTEIGYGAFEQTSLKRIIINNENVNIVKDAFNGCDSNLKIYVPVEDYKTATNWSDYSDNIVIGTLIGDWLVKLDKTNSTCQIARYFGDLSKEELIVPAKFEHRGTTYKTTSIGSTVDYDEIPDISLLEPVFNNGEYLDDFDYVFAFLLSADEIMSNGELASLIFPSFKRIIVEDGIEIGNYAFMGCYNLEQITMPSNITSLGVYSFYACYKLNSIKLPENLKKISPSTFGLCLSLESIDLPASVEIIGDGAFGYCINLKSVDMKSKVKTIGEDVFGNCIELTSITIPSSVTSIGDQAFSDCYHLAEVINMSSASLIDTHAERYAVRIVTSGTTKITDEGDFKFVQGTDGSDYVVGYFGKKNTNVLVPSYKEALSMVLPSRSTNYKVKQYAFYNERNLISVTIPQCVTEIGENAFGSCDHLSEVINMSSASLDASHAKNYAVRIVTSGTSQIQTQNDFKFVLGNDRNNYLIGYFGNKSFQKGEISLPQTSFTYRIKSHAFEYIEMPEILVIPNCVDYIGDYAFAGSSSNFSVVIADSVTYIGYESFTQNDGWDNTGLRGDMTIGSGVTYIAGNIGCDGVMTIKATTPPKLDGSFMGLYGQPSAIYVPEGSVDAYKNAEGWSTFADRIYAIS